MNSFETYVFFEKFFLEMNPQSKRKQNSELQLNDADKFICLYTEKMRGQEEKLIISHDLCMYTVAFDI